MSQGWRRPAESDSTGSLSPLHVEPQLDRSRLFERWLFWQIAAPASALRLSTAPLSMNFNDSTWAGPSPASGLAAQRKVHRVYKLVCFCCGANIQPVGSEHSSCRSACRLSSPSVFHMVDFATEVQPFRLHEDRRAVIRRIVRTRASSRFQLSKMTLPRCPTFACHWRWQVLLSIQSLRDGVRC